MRNLTVQTCTFVSLTDFLSLIEDEKVKNQFREELNNGDATFGSNKRSMVTIEYIKKMCKEVIDCPFDGYTLNDDYFQEALATLEAANTAYVDLES